MSAHMQCWTRLTFLSHIPQCKTHTLTNSKMCSWVLWSTRPSTSHLSIRIFVKNTIVFFQNALPVIVWVIAGTILFFTMGAAILNFYFGIWLVQILDTMFFGHVGQIRPPDWQRAFLMRCQWYALCSDLLLPYNWPVLLSHLDNINQNCFLSHDHTCTPHHV